MAKKPPEEKTKELIEKKIHPKDIKEQSGEWLGEAIEKISDEIIRKDVTERRAIARKKLSPKTTNIDLSEVPIDSWENFTANEKRDQIKRATRNLLILGNAFLEAASWGDDWEIRVFIEGGFSVNHQDPHTGSTALHKAAASQARDVIRELLRTGGCDFLIRDNKGRLPSEMAYLYGHDPALARLLGNKERKQAEAKGIKLTRRPAKPQP